MNPVKMKLDALIFDMDGVLVDSEPLHLRAFQQMMQRYGHSWTEEENRRFLGQKDIEIAAIMIEELRMPLTPHSMVEEKEMILREIFKKELAPRPGLMTTLKTASTMSLPMAVASSATLPTIELVVDLLGIRSSFKTLTSGDEVPKGKPAPDVFLLAAKRLGAEPERCLVIEDTLNGIRAAKAAGMKCVAIPCDATRHEDHSLADLRLESLAHLNLSEWR